MNSLLEEMGLSENDFGNLDPDLQASITERYSQLVAARLIGRDQMLQDDDDFLRDRNTKVTNQILGLGDTKPMATDEKEMRHTILGHTVNIGDEGVRRMFGGEDKKEAKEPPKTSFSLTDNRKPQSSGWKNAAIAAALTGLFGASVAGAGITGYLLSRGGDTDTDTRNTIRFVEEPEGGDAE